MRICCSLIVLAALAAANPRGRDAIRLNLLRGDASEVLRLLELHTESLAQAPQLAFDVCLFAADAVPCLPSSSRNDDLVEAIRALADRALEVNEKDAVAKWAAQEATLFDLRMRGAPADGFIKVAGATDAVVRGTPLATRGSLRAIEVLLEAAQRGGGKTASIAAAAPFGERETDGDVPMVAAVRQAARSLELAARMKRGKGAKEEVAKGLHALLPHLEKNHAAVIARYNDLVDLADARKLGIGARHRAWRHGASLEFEVRLSRNWRVLEAGDRTVILQLEPDGRPLREITLMTSAHPNLMHVASRLYEEAKERIATEMELRPARGAALNKQFDDVVSFEVKGRDAHKGYRRRHTYCFSGKDDTHVVSVLEYRELDSAPLDRLLSSLKE